jgi:NADH:ubiquinone oxidoreductase subunit 6 (subunit J)
VIALPRSPLMRISAAGAAAAVVAGALRMDGFGLLVCATLGLAAFIAMLLASSRSWSTFVGAAVALGLFLVMGLVVASTAPWQGDSGNETSMEAANDTQGIVDSLFGPNVIGFEVLGILLTAIMIGALVIARPLDAQSDADRYSHPTAAQVAESDHASNVKASLARDAAADDPAATRFKTEEARE